ncbi:MAG: NAD-dependent DNA ligase LigA [Bacteroidia bacterium]|nr:NAD-dependent DNA ligase LigA [Bacteroidia bacterium]
MNPSEAKQRIENLSNELHLHNYRYYVLAEPSISDFEFDQLLKELEYLENQFPEFKSPESPTQKVGGQTIDGFVTEKHKRAMLSLGNTYNEDELKEFDERVRSSTGLDEIEYVCELKIDGLAISVFFENGELVKAVTRGDGVQGDIVTENVKTIRNLPKKLKGDFPAYFEVRGEIFMHRKGFERLNEQRIQAGEPTYANPRNVASGSLKIKDSSEVAKRPLDIFLYQLYEDQTTFSTHSESLDAAFSWGLPVPGTSKTCKGIDQVIDFLHEWDNKRHDLSFDTDGVVIKVNSKRLQEELGFTAKTPRWAIAYKFQTETASTLLLGITYQVGRTGAITPVAELQPVQLLGTTVKRASLHNANEMARLDVRVGDTVFVEKGGEIIPKIVGIDFSLRPEGLPTETYITHCPECSTELVRNDGEAQHYCPNEEECPPQVVGKLEHFIGRKAMDIQSVGSELCETLYQNNLVRKPSDFYRLTMEHLLQLERMGEKSARNIVEGIENSKKQPFERVLFGMGIRYVGETVAKKLAQAFVNIENLVSASVEELIAVDEIGQRIAETVHAHFRVEKHLEEVQKLKEAGLTFEAVIAEKKGHSLEGKSFVISGVFEKHSRDELKDMVESHGGKMASGVTSKTNYLIAGSGIGPSKLEKAEKLGVPLISEDDLMEMIGDR